MDSLSITLHSVKPDEILSRTPTMDCWVLPCCKRVLVIDHVIQHTLGFETQYVCPACRSLYVITLTRDDAVLVRSA